MQKTAGLLYFLAGAILFFGILFAEIFYPDYSISKDFISNLASTRPPDIVIRQPSATIFNASVMIAGIIVILASGVFRKVHARRDFITLSYLMGIGTLGIGIFPAFYGTLHPIIAAFVFFAGGVAALASSRIVSSPFSYVCLILGEAAVAYLLLGIFMPEFFGSTFGAGGTERLIAYPIIIWLIVFGGYLMNRQGDYSK